MCSKFGRMSSYGSCMTAGGTGSAAPEGTPTRSTAPMGEKHQGRQTAEWLVVCNALDTLEEFRRAQGDDDRGIAIDRDFP